MISKRKLSDTFDDTEENKKLKTRDSNQVSSNPNIKALCKNGQNCHNKDPVHLIEFEHASVPQSHSESVQTYFFLTKVSGIENRRWNNNKIAISLNDILNDKANKLIKSAQFNYLFDIDWLMQQYGTNKDKPLLIVHGLEGINEKQLKSEANGYDSVNMCKVRLDIPYGTHHTKMMFLLYENGLKVVIHTANLIPEDWNAKTQGVWMSELFPQCQYTENNTYDSKTKFKEYLIMYLEHYRSPVISEWIDLVKNHDMSSANVFLIGSVPGRFIANKNNFGHLRMKNVLSKYCKIDDKSFDETKLVFQFSSIGSLGTNESSWLCTEFYSSLNANTKPEAKSNEKKPICIYPNTENVRTSLEGYRAGGSLPYSHNTASKQKYLDHYFYEWKAENTGRTRASPHIKTYAKYSKDFDHLFWFLLTSSNLSKAAWGVFEKNKTQLMIRSYEIGVLFLPEMINDKSIFESNKEFYIPYDLPPKKYNKGDRPWIVDISYLDQPDSHGRFWKIN